MGEGEREEKTGSRFQVDEKFRARTLNVGPSPDRNCIMTSRTKHNAKMNLSYIL